MRADGLAQEGEDHRGGLAAAEADGKMVGPEPDQPLAERRVGGQQPLDRGLAFPAYQIAHAGWLHAVAVVLGRLEAFLVVLAQRHQPVSRAGARRGQRRVGSFELTGEPVSRVGGRRLLAPPAQAKTDQRLGGSRVHGIYFSAISGRDG